MSRSCRGAACAVTLLVATTNAGCKDPALPRATSRADADPILVVTGAVASIDLALAGGPPDCAEYACPSTLDGEIAASLIAHVTAESAPASLRVLRLEVTSAVDGQDVIDPPLPVDVVLRDEIIDVSEAITVTRTCSASLPCATSLRLGATRLDGVASPVKLTWSVEAQYQGDVAIALRPAP